MESYANLSFRYLVTRNVADLDYLKSSSLDIQNESNSNHMLSGIDKRNNEDLNRNQEGSLCDTSISKDGNDWSENKSSLGSSNCATSSNTDSYTSSHSSRRQIESNPNPNHNLIGIETDRIKNEHLRDNQELLLCESRVRNNQDPKETEMENTSTCVIHGNESKLENEATTHLYQAEVYTCQICNLTYKKWQKYKKHIEIHTNETTEVMCVVCKLQFVNRYSLKIHMKMHPTATRVKCRKCYNTWKWFKASRKDRKLKAQMSHIDEEELISSQSDIHKYSCKRYQCDICDHYFAETRSFFIHRCKHFHKSVPISIDENI